MPHTPGPWSVFIENGVVEIQKRKRPVVHWSGFDSSLFKKSSEANARLMAAAPDMLDALKLALLHISAIDNQRVCDVIEAAIAKAENGGAK